MFERRFRTGFEALLCALSVLLALPRLSSAGPLPFPPHPHYVFQHIGDEQGLGTKTVTALFQDKTGFIWIGCQDGLYRYDGMGFDRFGREQGLPAESIEKLVESPDGVLWVATSGGIAKFSSGRFVPLTFSAEDGDPTSGSGAMAIGSDGSLYVATSRGLLLAGGDSDRKRRLFAIPEEPARVESVAIDPKGTVWILTERRIGHLVSIGGAGKIELDPELNGLPADRFRVLAFDGAGTLWVRSANRLARRDSGTAGFVLDDAGLPPPNDLAALAFDRSGEILVPTGLGLFRKVDGRREGIGRKQGTSSEAVFSSFEDREGSLWLGLGGAGLDRWPGRNNWSAWTTSEGLPNEVVWCSARDRENRLFVGTNDGLAEWDSAAIQWRVRNEKDGLAGRTVRQIVAAPDGTIWTLSVPGGVTRLDPHSGAILKIPLPAPWFPKIPSTIVVDEAGIVWLGGRSGLFRCQVKANQVTVERMPVPGEMLDAVGLLSPASRGVLWSGGRRGVSRLENGRWKKFGNADGLRDESISEIAAAGPDDVWIAYRNAGGLTHLTLDRGSPHVRHFSEADGLPGRQMYFLAVDRLGRAWAGGDSGVARIDTSGSVRRFGRQDGLLWDDTSDHGFFEDHDGSILIGTSRGLARYDRSVAESNPDPPAVVLKSVALGAIERIPGETTTVRWSERLFSARFAGLTFRNPASVRFRYRLAGLEKDWSETALREVRYPSLPSGTYRFEVNCRSAAGVMSLTPAAFRFTILPPWWQSWPFRIFLLIAGLLTALGVFRVRVARLVAAKARLERLVVERTRELAERNKQLGLANEKITQAQRQILQLQERASLSAEDLPGWTKTMAKEIAGMVGVSEIGVWIVDADEISPLSTLTLQAPSREQIDAARGRALEDGDAERPSTLVPLLGPSAEVRGALVIPARISAWGVVERQLVDSFARHLGTTLDLQRLRQRLVYAEADRAQSLKQMQESGVDTLQECSRCGRCFDHKTANCPDDGAILVSSRILPYRIAGRHRLIRLLGEGGMGAVFEAHDEKLARDVAVKIIKSEHLKDTVMRIRLEREAHTVARIHHPNVVALHDSGELPDGSAFLVMELLLGHDLAYLVERDGPGTPQQVARVLSQVGSALCAAHALGVIHRDLKPGNLFLVPGTEGFQTKVVDFGLAKAIGDDTGATASGIVVGSPAYMSPEQVRDAPLDVRSDLFSLASVTFELLTGKRAFQAKSVSDILTRVLLEDPPPLSALLEGATRDIDDALGAALEKQTAKRPANIDEWIRRIVPILEAMPSSVAGWKTERPPVPVPPHENQPKTIEARDRPPKPA